MRAQPSYIRTIKPNQNRSSTEYDTKAVLHQVKYLGLHENIRVRRAGFAYRNTFEKVVERFYLLSPATSYAGEYTWQGDAKSGCERILTDTGIAREEWQMGVTKAFIKNPETVGSSILDVCGRRLKIRIALRIGDDARPVLAQYGGTHPACVPELPAVQERVCTSHPTLLEEQQGGYRVCEDPRLRTPDSCWTERAEEIQFARFSPLHG